MWEIIVAHEWEHARSMGQQGWEPFAVASCGGRTEPSIFLRRQVPEKRSVAGDDAEVFGAFKAGRMPEKVE